MARDTVEFSDPPDGRDSAPNPPRAGEPPDGLGREVGTRSTAKAPRGDGATPGRRSPHRRRAASPAASCRLGHGFSSSPASTCPANRSSPWITPGPEAGGGAASKTRPAGQATMIAALGIASRHVQTLVQIMMVRRFLAGSDLALMDHCDIRGSAMPVPHVGEPRAEMSRPDARHHISPG